jgi:hypothetical protein
MNMIRSTPSVNPQDLVESVGKERLVELIDGFEFRGTIKRLTGSPGVIDAVTFVEFPSGDERTVRYERIVSLTHG